MIHLPRSLEAWNSPDFEDALKRELEQLGAGKLPLQQGLSTSSYAMDDTFNVMVIGVVDGPGSIHAKVGIFYFGITAGCNCADDPTTVEPQSEYCELVLAIDKTTGEAAATLLAD